MFQAKFGVFRALWGSFLAHDLTFFPRREQSPNTIPSKELINSIRTLLEGFAFDTAELEKASDPKLLLDRARDSLEESKKQTEYQDAKAGRLLTIIAFLTAAVSTVFGKFVDLYPLHSGLAPANETSLLVAASYLLFGVYLLLVAAGALVTFHAISTRFVWPGGSDLADQNEALSLLFFQQIIRTKPESWGSTFAGDKGELLRTYYKNYVTEAYLVATKVADKLRYLDPAQRLLIASIRVLFGLFLLIILTLALVQPPPKAAVLEASSATTALTTPPVAGAPVAVQPVPHKAASAIRHPEGTSSGAAVAASATAPKASAQSASKKE